MTKQLNVALPPALRARVEQHSASIGVNLSTVIRMSVLHYLNQVAPQPQQGEQK